jgi:DNA-binding SARP family transcriptional activator/class 3 adenylate cyclase
VTDTRPALSYAEQDPRRRAPYHLGVEIRLLGPVEAIGRDGLPMGLGGPKERIALALLALSANRVVSEDRLIGALWADEPPRTAARTLQSHLSRLRQAMSDEATLESAGGGWVLRVEADIVDAARFEALVTKGRRAASSGDWLEAASSFGSALALWRGRALEGFADQLWAAGETARLEELRLCAFEERAEAELACGRHHEVIADLQAVCRAEPLRERLWGQLMLALYRAGRQADALRAFQQLRRTLIEELGIEPNPALGRLEQSIVTQSPSLDWRPPTTVAATGPPSAPTGVAADVRSGHRAQAASGGLVTLLFTDIAGSTELLSRMGEENFEARRRGHFELLRDAVARSGGSEIKTLGDGMMAAFGSAVDALGCAVAIQQAVARHNRRSGEGALGVRVGVHVGEAVRDEDDLFGLAVVVAKRLCDSAEAGQIRASRLVADLVEARGVFDFHDIGLLDLKGLPQPTAACMVGWSEQATLALPPDLAGTHDGAFVGRSHELGTLRGAWQRAQSGRQVTFLAGEPGIGKTTLATRAAVEAWAQGAVVLFGRCDEESLVPFQPFVEAIGHYVEATPAEELRQKLADRAADLALLVPGVARRLPEVARAGPKGTDTDRYRIFEAVTELFGVIGADAPVVVLIDDLHWADRPTLQLLTHVIRTCADVPLLVMGTYRDTDLVRTHPMAETLVDLRKANLVERVVLRGLSPDEVVVMVSGGADPSAGDRTLGLALWEQTEGSPLFLREILRHLSETGAVTAGDGGGWVATKRVEQLGIPEGVKEVIGRRLTRLSEQANIALRTGSVLGRELRLDVLERVTDLGSEELLDAMEEATAAGIVTEMVSTPGRWAFTHALVRHALYEELSLTRRVRLHQRVGEALEALAPDIPGSHLAELAFHFSQAAVAGGADKAIDYGRRAGEHALASAGYEEAARHFAAALEVAEDAGADLEVRADLLLAQGGAERRIGDPRPARATFERVVALVDRADPERMARAALGYAGGVKLRFWTQLGVTDGRCIELLESALEMLGPDDSELRALTLGTLAQDLQWVPGAEQRRDELSAEAVAMARRLGDAGTLASVLLARNLAMGSPEFYEEHRANATESLRLADELGDGQLRAWAITHLLLVHLWLGDVETAMELVGEGERAAAAIKEPAAFLFDQVRGCIAIVEGRLSEAEVLLRRGFAGGQEVRDPNTFLTFGAGITFLRLLQGRAIELAGSVEAMMVTMSGVGGMAHGARALMFSLHGMLDSARAQLDLVDPGDPSSLPRNVLLLGSLQALARACLLVGDGAKAEVIYDLMAPHERYDAVIGWVPLGPVSLGLGCAAAALGRTDAAAAHFEAALATVRARGWKSYIADTELHYAPLLAERDRPGDRERALAMTEELIAVSTELGAADHLSVGRALRSHLLSEKPTARVTHPEPNRWDRARARLTGFGRAAVASWTTGRSDEDLVRRFSGPGPQRLLFSTMARAFQPTMAFGFNGDITFDLRPPEDDGDPAAGDWWTIEVRGRKATAHPGRSSNPAVLIHAPLADFLRIAAGEAHPAMALMDNTVEVEGDVLLAARLPDMFGAVTRMPAKEPAS